MKTITLTDTEAKILAHHIYERLQRLEVNMGSTTQMAVIEDAEIQQEFYLHLLKQLGYSQDDLKGWEILLKH